MTIPLYTLDHNQRTCWTITAQTHPWLNLACHTANRKLVPDSNYRRHHCSTPCQIDSDPLVPTATSSEPGVQTHRPHTREHPFLQGAKPAPGESMPRVQTAEALPLLIIITNTGEMVLTREPSWVDSETQGHPYQWEETTASATCHSVLAGITS